MLRYVAVLLTALPLAAHEVGVLVRAPHGESDCRVSALNISAATLDGKTRVRVPVEKDSAVLKLASGGPWRIFAEGPACWSTVSEWSAGDGPVSLDIFPAATARGRLIGRSTGVGTIAGAVTMPRSKGPDLFVDGSPTDCAIRFPQWSCTVPAGVPVSLRVHVGTSAPLYFWDVTAAAGSTRELGERELVPGASLAGWLESPDGLPVAEGRVTLVPLVSSPDQNGVARFFTDVNKRGFFQLTGLPGGQYRLVAEAEGKAPTVLPRLTLKAGDAAVWPRPVTLHRFVDLEIAITPPQAEDGAAWQVELTEQVPSTADRALTIKTVPSGDGLFVAQRLRRDLYRVRVLAPGRTVVEDLYVDLTDGNQNTLYINVVRRGVRGRVLVGKEPLEAELQFSNGAGKIVRTTSDEDGQFSAVFPAIGRWVVTVTPEGSSARIDASPVDVSEASEEIVVVLPGGRIHGTVTDRSGTPQRAAVRARSGGKAVAQTLTDEEGHFDLLGIREGSYEVSADAEHGGTARPQVAQLSKDESVEMNLVIDEFATARARVVTPQGFPAAGAVVRLSTDAGVSWFDMTTDLAGEFELPVPAGNTAIQALVVTPEYPATLAAIGVSGSGQATIRLSAVGAWLVTNHLRVYLVRNGLAAPARLFSVDGAPSRREVYLEPGAYALCRRPAVDATCQQVQIPPGGRVTASLE